ncbi:Predicted AAA-ATPase [Lachnospiraceae bacterium]|nr:Predicted AAA-ATPase [Lachnospiraceae bacterium]
MGTYLNPGKTSFEEAVNSEIFIDKTEIISFLNTVVRTKQKYVSVSRPRRFGKTMAADMICSYYDRTSDSRALFERLNISSSTSVFNKNEWDLYLGKFDVIRLVMTKFFKKSLTVEQSLDTMQRMVIRDIKKEYPDADLFNDADLLQTIEDIYSQNN